MHFDDFKITNKNIELALIQLKDADELFKAIQLSLNELRTFPASLPWALATPSLEASQAFCRSRVVAALDQENFVYVIRTLDNQNFIGVMDIHQIDWKANSAAVGFWGNAQYKQQGYMTQALQLFISTLLNKFSFQQLLAYVDADNNLARALCERADFKLIEIKDAARQNPVDGSLRDICQYKIEKAD